MEHLFMHIYAYAMGLGSVAENASCIHAFSSDSFSNKHHSLRDNPNIFRFIYGRITQTQTLKVQIRHQSSRVRGTAELSAALFVGETAGVQ